jgi:hypothetical protein
VVSAGAVGVILLGAVPMAAAQASRAADPILAESIARPGLIDVNSVLLFEHQTHIHRHVPAQHVRSQSGLPPVGHLG